ncbi:uncharacterized protein LOC128998574 [Macrosteles quadrilineatus]|uniref:uncharacterized protein LOC128998574 n=1 Tax=Macrosteles quadrilineatus TaxID=74068 RepID=UPI0023E1712F|nr:uncharacterized protein LOC128998574 [Macrosteles quadrilineatus]
MGKKNKSLTPKNSPATPKLNPVIGKKTKSPVSEGKKKAIKENFKTVNTLTTPSKGPQKKITNSPQPQHPNGKQNSTGTPKSKKKRNRKNKKRQSENSLTLSPEKTSVDKTPTEKPLSKRARRKLAKLRKEQDKTGEFIPLEQPAKKKKAAQSPSKNNAPHSDKQQGTNLFESDSDESSDDDEDVQTTDVSNKSINAPSTDEEIEEESEEENEESEEEEGKLNIKASSEPKPKIMDFGSEDDDDDEEEASSDSDSEEVVNNKLHKTKKENANDSQDSQESQGSHYLSLEASTIGSSPIKRKKEDLSDDSDVEGKNFIDDEAEEGNETSDESAEEEEEEPSPVQKKRKITPNDDQKDGRFQEEHKIFVGGLAPNSTEDDLREALSDVGNIVAVHVPLSREVPGECRGFAFVTLKDQKSVTKAISLSEQVEVNGKSIFIRKYNSEPGGGGQRGGGRGNFGGGRGRGRGGFRGGRGGFRGDRNGNREGRGGFRGGRGGGDYGSRDGRGGRGGSDRGGRGRFNRGRGRGSKYFL